MIASQRSVGERLNRRQVLDARVVNQDVEAAKRVLGGLDQRGNFLRATQVGVMIAHCHSEILGDAAPEIFDLSGSLPSR